MKNEKLNKFIASKVGEIRKDNNLTQTDLSQLLGVTRITISNLEKGIQRLDVANIYKLCCLFDLMPNSFFPEIKKIELESKTIKKIIPKKVKYDLVYKKVLIK